MASQITGLTMVYSTAYSGADQGRHQSSASLAFVRGIHRWPVNSPHKGPVTRKMFLFDDVIMICQLMKNPLHGVYQAYIRTTSALYTITTLSIPNLPQHHTESCRDCKDWEWVIGIETTICSINVHAIIFLKRNTFNKAIQSYRKPIASRDLGYINGDLDIHWEPEWVLF